MNAPDIFALGGRDDTRAQLRRACEALAAEYRAPLPEGDAGLIAAIERWRTLKPRHPLCHRLQRSGARADAAQTEWT